MASHVTIYVWSVASRLLASVYIAIYLYMYVCSDGIVVCYIEYIVYITYLHMYVSSVLYRIYYGVAV